MARPARGDKLCTVQLASAVLLTAMLVTPLASDAKKGDQLWTERRNSAPQIHSDPRLRRTRGSSHARGCKHFSRTKGPCLLFKRPRNVGP